MTFSKLIATIAQTGRVPSGTDGPKVGVRVGSAEGYVGRYERLQSPRAPKLREGAADRIVDAGTARDQG